MWLWRTIVAFFGTLFILGGGCQMLAWMLGAEDETRAYLIEHRGETIILLMLSFIMYSVFKWIEASE